MSGHDRILALVLQMLALHKKLPAAKTPHEKSAVQNQIAATDPPRRTGVRVVRADGGRDTDCGGRIISVNYSQARAVIVPKSNATAESFWNAFQSLSARDRQAVLRRMLDDKALRHDLQDLATIARRRKEPSRPLREYLRAAR